MLMAWHLVCIILHHFYTKSLCLQWTTKITSWRKFVQLFNSLRLSDAYMHHQPSPWLIQKMACLLVNANHYLNHCWNVVNSTLRNKLEQNEILIKIHTFSFKKMLLKMSSTKWWPFCLSFNVLSVKMTRLKWHGIVTSSWEICWQ